MDTPSPGPRSSLRLARPSLDLALAETFWVRGLGLDVLFRLRPDRDQQHDLLMLGWPTASWHLELVHDAAVRPAPTEEDLLVLYVAGPIDPALVGRLVAAGGRRVTPRNSYWDEWGVTVEDPDGYRLVLSTLSWPT